MIKFLLTYWFGILLFFGLFYWDLSPISSILNKFQTDFTAYLTSLILPKNMIENHNIFISNNYSLVIEKACNGIIPYLFFLSSIVAFPSSIVHKIKWMLFGYILIVAMNTFRIWIVTKLVLKEPSNFSFAHDYLGNILLILTGLTLFVWFCKSSRSREKVALISI